MSGYCNCACRDCFDVAIADTEEDALCLMCREAGCAIEGDCECRREDAYDVYDGYESEEI